MVLPARSAMDWTELPFSTIYSTPRVFTARVTMPPLVRLYSTEARLAGTQAMSSSPCIRPGVTSSAEAARVKLYGYSISPVKASLESTIRSISSSVSLISFTMPMAVGPFRAATRTVTGSSAGVSSS